MGYWEEKAEYDAMNELLEHNKALRKFCPKCGIHFTVDNIKGKCVICLNVVCAACGKIYVEKVHCIDCLQRIAEERTRKEEREKVRLEEIARENQYWEERKQEEMRRKEEREKDIKKGVTVS